MSATPHLNNSFTGSEFSSDSGSDTTVEADDQKQGREAISQSFSKNLVNSPFPDRQNAVLASSAGRILMGPKKGTFVTSSTRKIYTPVRYLSGNPNSNQPPRVTGINPVSTHSIHYNHSLPRTAGGVTFSDTFKMSRTSSKRHTNSAEGAEPAQEVINAQGASRPSRDRKTRSLSSIAQLPTPESEANDESASVVDENLNDTTGIKVRMSFPSQTSQKRKFISYDADLTANGSVSKKQRKSDIGSLLSAAQEESVDEPQRPNKLPATAHGSVKGPGSRKRTVILPRTGESETDTEASAPRARAFSTMTEAGTHEKRSSTANSAAQEDDELAVAKFTHTSVSNVTRSSGRKRAPTKRFATRGQSETLSPEPEPTLVIKGPRRRKRSSAILQPEQHERESFGYTRVTSPATIRRNAPVETHGMDLDDVEPADIERVPVTATRPIKLVRKRTRTRRSHFEAELAIEESQPSTDAPQPRITPGAKRSSRRNASRSEEDDPVNTSRSLISRGKKTGPSWADREADSFELLRFLNSEESLAPDPLLKLPGPNHTYTDRFGNLKDPDRYALPARPAKPIHPKLTAHIKKGTDQASNRFYYQDLPLTQSLPLAGVIRSELPKTDPRYQIAVDFYGNVVQEEFDPYDGSLYPDFPFLMDAITNDDDEDYDDRGLTSVQEENFQSKAMVKLLIPDFIKAILVDDWENVTKNQQLVPLPAQHSVDDILRDYLEFEKPKRAPGPDPDILDEVIEGLKEYFEKCLGRILLYRFERAQYIEIRDGWLSPQGELSGKNASGTYGAEHLCRLIVTLPELIGQTNMDHQSVNRLKEELTKLTIWLEKNAHIYFTSEYETPAQEYIDRARSA